MVFTTIFDPILLDAYYENFQKFGHLDQVDVIVVPDRKTPAEAYSRCAEVSAKGLRTTCPTIAEQEDIPEERRDFDRIAIPYDSDNRRNVGYLMAYARACRLFDLDRRRQFLPARRGFLRRARRGLRRRIRADGSRIGHGLLQHLRSTGNGKTGSDLPPRFSLPLSPSGRAAAASRSGASLFT